MSQTSTPRPNDLDAFWMPFTANRAYKAYPRLLARAEGMHYFTPDGPRSPRRHLRPLVRQRRARAARDHRGRSRSRRR